MRAANQQHARHDLTDDAGALAHFRVRARCKRLQGERIGRLGGDEFSSAGATAPWQTLAHRAKPDDAVLVDLLAQSAPEEAARHRSLVDNPARLYGFS